MTKKKISEKKLQANRRNAQKSTGPKTPEGKAQSSRNAIKHGLLAQQILIDDDDDPNERQEDFDQLLNGLIEDYQPSGCTENLLIERIAICFWRLRRAYRYEAQCIEEDRQDEFSPLNNVFQQVSGRRPNPLKHVLPTGKQMERLLRYESMIDRQLNRALNQLQNLQRFRKSNTNPRPSASICGSTSNSPAQNEPKKRSSPTIKEGINKDNPPEVEHESPEDFQKHLAHLSALAAQNPDVVRRLTGLPISLTPGASSFPQESVDDETKPNVETQSKSRVHRGEPTEAED